MTADLDAHPLDAHPLDGLAVALAAQQNGVFARWQLPPSASPAAIDYRTRSGRWNRHAAGVYSVAGAPDSWHFRLRIALLESGRGSVVSHRSAAALHRLPGFAPGRLDIERPQGRSRRERAWSRARTSSRVPAEHVTQLEGFPCTTLARTLFDLAGLSSPVRLRRGWHYVPEQRVARALDDALSQRGLPLESLAAVIDELGKPGRPGTQLMRRLLDDRADGSFVTESELEDLFLSVLKRYGIKMPERQRTLGDDRGSIGRVDFVYPSIRLVIEADSRKHHSALEDWERDKWRDLHLAASGWMTLRISWAQLKERPGQVAELLRRALDRASLDRTA